MKYLIAFLLNLIPLAVLAQGEGNHLIRDGNKLYDTGNFEEASSKYDEALNKDQNSFEGGFNLGDSYYRQEKYEEAADQFELLTNQETSKENIAKAFHNLGNAHIKNNKIDKGIDAYKKSLMNNPNDYDTKHNLSYAQRLKKQQEQQKQDQDKKEDDKENEDKEKKEDEEKKDGDKNEEEDGDKEEGDEDKEKDEDKKDGDKDEEKEDEGDDKKEQPKPEERDGVSKEDAERLLDALNNDEEELQKELMKKKQKSQVIQINKPW
ncbi:MAG: tetratricopeptide repeat protein [Flavobacteriales bacterium]|nr:tetratricopeptide repeat protein [Flavobacteriales bacterium]